MKLFNTDHIAMLPYSTCNFKCEYCVAAGYSKTVTDWGKVSGRVKKYLSGIDKKAIMLSGGEPLIWDWSEIVKYTGGHIWYVLSNLSLAKNSWLSKCKDNVRLIISSYHKSQIDRETYTGNVKYLQDMGFPVFVKIIYTDESRFSDVEHFWKNDIASSMVPVLGRKYSKIPYEYITSTIYKNRFERRCRFPLLCRAGTENAYEIRYDKIVRCSMWGEPYNSIDNLGTVDDSKLHSFTYPCPKIYCDCEWVQFSEMSGKNDNERWQKFVNTGIWQGGQFV